MLPTTSYATTTTSLEEFGNGKAINNDNSNIWNPVIRQAMIAGFIRKDIEHYGLLVTAAGKFYLKDPKPFSVVPDREFVDTDEGGEGGTSALDENLHKQARRPA